MHYGFRKAHLAGQFKGKGRARKALLQNKEGRHRGSVKLHCAVYDAGFGGRCIQFEVGIVGGDNAVCPAGVKLMEDGFRYGAAGRGFRSASKFVYEHQRLGIGHT